MNLSAFLDLRFFQKLDPEYAVQVLLHPAAQNLKRFYENRYSFKNYANVSFVYQIHDKDFHVWTPVPVYRRYGMLKWNLLSYSQYVGLWIISSG